MLASRMQHTATGLCLDSTLRQCTPSSEITDGDYSRAQCTHLMIIHRSRWARHHRKRVASLNAETVMSDFHGSGDEAVLGGGHSHASILLHNIALKAANH
ncbi:hypothetical protein EVG20_g6927 [Dentipellis fragilis]|uniref:Uncharacterized protein n=1 Tax=Dentipellis fragilis TaxID=205917 RepID=A0A4Y9YK03_9AGAM|nr:hypothetical protein EVG20_g6927 [Dentipellis fragilis]